VVEGREVEVELEVRLEDVMGRLHGSLVWSGCGCCLVLVLLVVAPLLVLACWVFSGASSERWSSGGAATSSATPARLARQLLLPARLTSQHSHQTRMNRQPKAESCLCHGHRGLRTTIRRGRAVSDHASMPPCLRVRAWRWGYKYGRASISGLGHLEFSVVV